MKPSTRVHPAAPVRTGASLAAALLALVGPMSAPAAAARVVAHDPVDTGGASLNDIRRVAVVHDPDRLVVRTRVVDLRRRSEGGPAGMTIRIDKRAGRPGPEFRLTTGLNAGTDYQLTRVRRGRPVGEPLTCAHRVRLDFADDAVRLRAAADCFGDPERLRIGVKVRDLYDGSHPVTDWLGEPRSWTRWVRVG